jgi:hypothetical protein
MIQAIMELGSAAGPATSRLDVELIRLLPGESYAVQFENPSLNHQEYLELITDGTIQTRYSNCSLIPVAYAPGIVGFSVSRKAVELMAARGSRHARQLLTATELECRWGTANSDDKYYYPINAISHDGAAEYFWKNRSDQYLIDVISELGHEAGHPQAKLRVQHIRVLPNETYQVEYACPVGYGYYDDEQITINAKPKPKAEPKVQIKATLTATIQV